MPQADASTSGAFTREGTCEVSLSSRALPSSVAPVPRRPEPPQQTGGVSRQLADRVRRGAFWSGLTAITLRLSNFAVTAVVAHILAPRSFGVFAIAVTVYAVVVNLGELGVGSCIIRADLDVDALAPTMVTVSTASTALCAVAMLVFARPIAGALGSTDATGPIRVMALTVFLIGVFAVPIAQLTRDLKQDTLFLATLAGFVPATAALLVLATAGDGAMAFAWSRALTQVGGGCVAVVAVSKIYRPGWTRHALSVLVRFGLPLAAANFVTYILLNVDYAFVGHLLGATALGSYMLAFTLASAPAGMLAWVINGVAVPSISRVSHDRDLLNGAICSALRVVALIVLPLCGLMMVLAHPLVVVIYGAKWKSAAEALSILSLYGAISVFCVLFANVMTSVGKTRFILVVQLIWLGALIPAMTIGVKQDGIAGAAMAHIAVIGPLVLPCYLLAMRKATGVRIAALGRAVLPPLTVASVAALAARAVASQFANPVSQVTLGLAAGALVYAIGAAPQGLELLSEETAGRLRPLRFFRIYDSAARLMGLTLKLDSPLRRG